MRKKQSPILITLLSNMDAMERRKRIKRFIQARAELTERVSAMTPAEITEALIDTA